MRKNKGNKKPWFGKRWTKAAIDWMDYAIFARKDDDTPFATVSSGFCINLTVGIVAAAVIVIGSLFGDQETLQTYLLSAAGGCALLYSIWFLCVTLGYFNSVWAKIGRSVYVVVINLIGCCIGIIMGVYLTLAAIAVLIIIIALKCLAGDSSSSSSKSRRRVYINDSTEINERQCFGEEPQYYDNSGRRYDKVGENTYVES